MEYPTYEDIAKANKSLKTTNIKGKEYIDVSQRVRAFRELFGFDWLIDTTIDVIDGGKAAYGTTSIIDPEGHVVSVGHAYEERAASMVNRTSFIENCETSAVGRALGFLGIGCVDSIASADEVASAQAQQTRAKVQQALARPPKQPAAKPKATPSKPKAAKPQAKKPSAASRKRLADAVKGYSERHGLDPKKIAAGVRKRPDFAETDEMYALIAEELESA